MPEYTRRFLDMGKGSAVFNMALDESLMSRVSAGTSSPVFRVYGWENPSITLGYSQNTDELIDFDQCIADGVDVTRRPTGGRSVYHDSELAYAIAGYVNDPVFGGSIMDTYRAVSMLLCHALRNIGVNAKISRGHADTSTDFKTRNPCFLSTSRFEITCGGKKLIGSAQRRFRNVFLQHGSILTGPGQDTIITYRKRSASPEKM